MKPIDLEQVARDVDLECTGADDHDYENCEKCARLHERITVALRRVVRECADVAGSKRSIGGRVVYGFPYTRERVLAAFGLKGE